MKPAEPAARGMAGLKAVKATLQARQRAAEQLLVAQKQQKPRLIEEGDLFKRAAGAVTAMPADGRSRLQTPLPEPLARQRLLDEQAALAQTLSDDFDVSTLLEIDEHLSFRRPGIGADVTRKLRRGHWSIQRQLDLHGLRSDAARATLADFLRDASAHGLRCVRVVHGKGLGSPGKAPVLKNKVHAWLVQKKEVLAFVQARPAEGGAGALVVLLQPSMRVNA